MPRTPINYEKGVVYKLCCLDPAIRDVYVGSTTDVTRRKSLHKQACNNPNVRMYNYYVYQFIRDNGGWANWDLVEIEKYAAADKADLHRKERWYIETLGASLNKVIPTRTKAEYREDHKDALAERKKQYRENNKEKIAERGKQYYEDHKDAFAERGKQYREDHKDAIAERKKQYYEDHKNKILAKYVCECGSEITRGSKARHERTTKHMKHMNSINDIVDDNDSNDSGRITSI